MLVALDKQLALRRGDGCLGAALIAASGQSPKQLGKLNAEVRRLRDAIYASIDGSSPGL